MTSEWFMLRYWGGGKGPWTTYRAYKDYKCSSAPPHDLARSFPTFDEALGIAREHMAERPTKRYPLAVFSSHDTLIPLAIIEGEFVCKSHPDVPRYSCEEMVVCV